MIDPATNALTPEAKFLLFALFMAILVLVAVIVLVTIIRGLPRRKFNKEYGIDLSRQIKVKHRKQALGGDGLFTLGWPVWASAKKDGTRDRRVKGNSIIWISSVLDIDGWHLEGKDPFVFYWVVNKLRAQGNRIRLCSEEADKRQWLLAEAASQAKSDSIDEIIARFESRPSEFEAYCADIFAALGWEAEVTPPVRDGGFDLRLRDTQGQTIIAECKCYAPANRVGRPVIQKLHGANAIEGADRMMVITTSTFSSDAVLYANQVDIELFDGDRLFELQEMAWGSYSDAKPVTEYDCRLTTAELKEYCPEDMFY